MRQYRTKRGSYVYRHCLRRERRLTYSTKVEDLAENGYARYARIYKISDNYAQKQTWSEQNKNIYSESLPTYTTVTQRLDYEVISEQKKQASSNIQLAFYTSMTHRWEVEC